MIIRKVKDWDDEVKHWDEEIERFRVKLENGDIYEKKEILDSVERESDEC